MKCVVGEYPVNGIERVGREGVITAACPCPALQAVRCGPVNMARVCLLDQGLQCGYIAQTEVDALSGQWVDDMCGVSSVSTRPAM